MFSDNEGEREGEREAGFTFSGVGWSVRGLESGLGLGLGLGFEVEFEVSAEGWTSGFEFEVSGSASIKVAFGDDRFRVIGSRRELEGDALLSMMEDKGRRRAGGVRGEFEWAS
jgi:hypothetical protein